MDILLGLACARPPAVSDDVPAGNGVLVGASIGELECYVFQHKRGVLNNLVTVVVYVGAWLIKEPQHVKRRETPRVPIPLRVDVLLCV